MARIANDEFLDAEKGNFEKINGDYFIKVIPSNSSGDFIGGDTPLAVETVSPYRKETDTTDGTVIYSGKAVLASITSASVWQIKRTTISGALISVEWADGDMSFDNSWDNRTIISYS
jgi:hypothetical protein